MNRPALTAACAAITVCALGQLATIAYIATGSPTAYVATAAATGTGVVWASVRRARRLAGKDR
jgi:hypothetical protein